MKILAINPGHNAAACLLENNKILFYIEEERLSRQKYDGNPFRAALIALQNHKIDYLILGGTDPGQYPQVTWTGETLFHAFARKFNPNIKIINTSTNHHLGHAFGAFYNSGFDKALSIVIDGSGSIRGARAGTNHYSGFETESAFIMEYPGKSKLVYSSIALPQPQEPTYKEDLSASHDIPIVKSYEAVTEYLGWHFIEAGKTMGLAPYGKADDEIPNFFDENGRVSLDYMIPQYPGGAHIRLDNYEMEHLKTGNPGSTEWHRDPTKVTDIAKNLAWRIQDETQNQAANLIRRLVEKTGIKNVCISGGYGLNCVANYYYKKLFPDLNIYIDPISHDGGTTIGIAKLFYHRETKSIDKNPLTTLYLGPKDTIDYTILENPDKDLKIEDATHSDIAKFLSENKIVALYQGSSEGGPRALGNRSILYNPADPNGKDHVNIVKGREWFRPFAGSMLQEHFSEWFETYGLEESPYMMYAMDFKQDKKDLLPAITHVDGTCRIQTVTKEQNKNYYDIIEEFYKLSGIPIIFNTSFNLAGEPLVETVEDAIRTLKDSKIDYLYFADVNKVVSRNEV